MSTETTEALVKVVAILNPLPSEERQRVIAAALVLLGEKPVSAGKQADEAEAEEVPTSGSMPARARTWMKQNGLTDDALEEVFHISDGNAVIIASDVPGKGAREKSLNTYVLVGIANLLATGVPSFGDQLGRDTCQNLGCYDAPNHAKYLAARGNEFSGNKDKGWELTAPGLKRGAALINEIRAKS